MQIPSLAMPATTMPSDSLPPAALPPDNAAVLAHLRACAQMHPSRVRLVTGRSTEGRRLCGAILTDPDRPAADKQHALIVAGRHGNEETGRMTALALIDWLLSPGGRATLRHQVVAVLPNVNPDACARDGYRHPSGPDVGGDLDTDEPLAESQFLDRIAQRLQPDLLIDLHAMGHVGCTYDMTLFPEPRPYTEDDNLFHQVATTMCEAGERAGLPHLSHPMRWWDAVDTGICARYYGQMKTLAMLTESAESNTVNHPLALRRRSALAKVKAALALGQRRHPKLLHAGYPTALVIGSYHLGLVALGRTASIRRRGRVALWQQRDHVVHVGSDGMPMADRHKCYRIEYRGPPLAHPLGLQVLVRHGQGPRQVTLAGKLLPPTAISTWRYQGMTCVVVALPTLTTGTLRCEMHF